MSWTRAAACQTPGQIKNISEADAMNNIIYGRLYAGNCNRSDASIVKALAPGVWHNGAWIVLLWQAYATLHR
jgi:cell wall assembly regulator SMI1